MKALLLFLFLFTLTAVAQDTTKTAVDTTVTTIDPETALHPAPSGVYVPPPMTDISFSLSLCVLGFGLLLIIGEIILVYRLNISPQDTIKFIIVTLIVIGSLYLITAGYTNDQIAPAMGLLGTIAGYLLGKMGPESASNNSNANTNTNT